MKAWRDRASQIEGSFLDGKMDTALRMKADNLPMNQIIKYTGLSEEQIRNL
jgi:hypothetical protein